MASVLKWFIIGNLGFSVAVRVRHLPQKIKMMIEHLEINNYKTVIIHPSKTSKEYTIYSNDEKGTAIISNENKNIAIEEYTKAIQLLSAIRKLFLYSSLYKRIGEN